MSQPYVVRRLNLADVPAMVSIIESTRHEYGVQRRTQWLLEPSDLDLHTTYQEPRSDYFVATHAGIVAGGGGIAPLDGAGEETCELQRMYLGARHRGKGVGQSLLKECLRRAACSAVPQVLRRDHIGDEGGDPLLRGEWLSAPECSARHQRTRTQRLLADPGPGGERFGVTRTLPCA